MGLATTASPDLFRALARLVRHPHRSVVVEHPLVDLSDLRHPTPDGLLAALFEADALVPVPREPSHFAIDGRRYLMIRSVDRRPRVSYDTYPNRFVKYVLNRYRRALQHLPDPSHPDVTRVIASIDGALAIPAFREVRRLHRVTAADPVLQRDPVYRRLLLLHLDLGRLLSESKP